MLNLPNLNRQAIFDLILIMATLILIKQALLPYSLLLAGPVSTTTAMILGSWLLSRHGISWSDLGLRKPKSWFKLLLLSISCLFTIAVTSNAASWLSDFFFISVSDSGRFDHIEGNSLAYLSILLLIWTHGSFFEELIFRAFMINRGSAILGGGLKADLISATFSSIFFGYRHYYYQGMRGALITGFVGLALSLLYLWFGRKNILPLILAHGMANTIGQTQRFLGYK